MKKIVLIILFLISLKGLATHNRAGEITYKRIAPLTQMVGGVEVPVYTYSFTIIKYTDHGGGIADRCVDTLDFGDGSPRGVAPRINSSILTGCGCPNCGSIIISDPGYTVKLNIYSITHTYAGTGTFTVRSADPNRNAGVLNMSSSVNQAFYIESLLIINGFTGANSSPVFANRPIDKACLGQCFYHNPGAYDPDPDDSLSYEITTSRGGDGKTVTGYSYPSGIFNINAVTGNLTWCSPSLQGQYNIAFIVKEWRKNTANQYQLIGYVLRDMQVIVDVCPNNTATPIIIVPPDTCVEAGIKISKKISAKDANYPITIYGTAGAYLAPIPIAAPSQTTSSSTSTVAELDFVWQTNCSHVAVRPYSTVFKAEDSGLPNKLVNFATYNIKVVPPSVKNVTATPFGSSINVSWQLSSCSPTNNPLINYKVYRKNDCSAFTYSPCQTGVAPTSGYALIGETASSVSQLTDDNNGNGLVVGQNYSYLVVAVYFDGSQSYASSQVCAQLKKDVPILLNVDILTTSVTTGSVYIKWHKPYTNTGNFDTLAFLGPYQFNLKYRSGSSGTYTTVFNSTKPNFYQLDTEFVHGNINTTDINKNYLVEFIAGTVTIGSSQRANSVFLSATPADRKINLQWNSNTPWNNYKYTIYRKNPAQTTFTATGTTTLTTYIDSIKVVNRSTYCYKVLSEGQYSDVSIPRPLLNNSQEICATAIDLSPPCTPTVSINADCITGQVQVTWTNVKEICNGSDDVVKYLLFYKPTEDDEYNLAATFSGASSTLYLPDAVELIAGCYAVQAVDSSNNISQRSVDFCIDNCPIFELPNIVTLNGDGINDFYKAVRVRQIKEIDLVIFDRWGNLVYKTKDPYFKWDGVSLLSKQVVSEGTFFYICDVFEPRVSGIKKRILKGFMQVVR